MALAEIIEDMRPFSAPGVGIVRGIFKAIKDGGTDSVVKPQKQRIFNLGTWPNAPIGGNLLTVVMESLQQTSPQGISAMEDDQATEVPAIAMAGPEWRAAAADLTFARGLFDGWKGPGSRKPSKSAADDAASILSVMATAFAATSRPVAPALGVDAGGEIVMSWSGREGLFGSMSINGDGTFAFYVERGNNSAEDGDLPIAGSLPKPFIDVLLGGEADHE